MAGEAMPVPFTEPAKPEYTPQTWHWAHAAAPEKAENPSAVAIKGFTKLGEATVKAGDQMLNASIQNDVNQSVDETRNKYLSELIRNDPTMAGRTGGPDGKSNTTQPSLIASSPNAELPADLKKLPKDVDSLMAWRANGASPTAYYMKLEDLAKQTRAKYPGRQNREYIDEQFKRASGVDPANAALHSAIQDERIRRDKADASRKKLESEIWQHPDAFEGGDIGKVLQDVRSGKLSEYSVATQIGKSVAYKSKLALQDLEFTNATRAQALDSQSKQDKIADETGGAMSLTMNGAVLAGTGDTQKVLDYVNDVESGKHTPDDEGVMRAASLMQALREKKWQEIYAKYHSVDPSTGKSLMETAGLSEEDLVKGLNTGSAGIDKFIAHVTNKEAGPAFLAQRMAAADASDDLLRMESDPRTGKGLRALHAANKAGGSPAAVNVLMGFYGLGTIGGEEDKDFTPSDRLTYLYNNILGQPKVQFGIRDPNQAPWPGDVTAPLGGGANTPAPPAAPGATPGPPTATPVSGGSTSTPGVYTYKRAAEESLKMGPQSPDYWQKLIDSSRLIQDTGATITERENVAKAAFDPANWGMISMFDKENRQMPGDLTAFNTFASPKMARAIMKLGNPTILHNYEDWVGHEWSVQHSQDMDDLNNLQGNFRGIVQFSYDNENSHWSWRWNDPVQAAEILSGVPGGGMAGSMGGFNTTYALDNAMYRINAGMDILRQNEDVLGGESANEKVLQLMITKLGLDPSIGRVEGIPSQMMDALIASHQQQEQEEANKAEAEEGKRAKRRKAFDKAMQGVAQ